MLLEALLYKLLLLKCSKVLFLIFIQFSEYSCFFLDILRSNSMAFKSVSCFQRHGGNSKYNVNVKYDVNYRHNKHYGITSKTSKFNSESETVDRLRRQKTHTSLKEAPPYESDVSDGDIPFSESFASNYGFVDNMLENELISVNSTINQEATGIVHLNSTRFQQTLSSGSLKRKYPLRFYFNLVIIITFLLTTLLAGLVKEQFLKTFSTELCGSFLGKNTFKSNGILSSFLQLCRHKHSAVSICATG